MDRLQDRVMIFIDGSNVYHSLKQIFSRTDLDFARFCRKLYGRRKLIRIYYYNAKVGLKEEPERFRHQQTFFTTIQQIPYLELRLGRLVYTNWPSVPPYEKGIDVQLATDMLVHSFRNNYDVCIAVGGDNDFVGALQAIKDDGKQVEVALFGRGSSSMQLRRVADKVITLNSRFLHDCWKSDSGLRNRPRPQIPTAP